MTPRPVPAKFVENHNISIMFKNPSSPTERSIPKFARSEITLGNLVGQGGFSLVFEVSKIEVDEVFDLSETQSKERKELAEEALQGGLGVPKFAIKMLRDDLMEDEHSKGVIDLAVEARLLKKLSHPNIISMK